MNKSTETIAESNPNLYRSNQKIIVDDDKTEQKTFSPLWRQVRYFLKRESVRNFKFELTYLSNRFWQVQHQLLRQ